jgi:citronellol/citronellal dehydrogenase
VEQAVKEFGGIDILINNASAISLTPTDQTDMKRYDLMNQINARGMRSHRPYFICHLTDLVQ